jgi:Flp pilus assembly protein TadG
MQSRASRFVVQSDGSMGIYALLIFVSVCMIVGLSMDVANAYKVRSEIQVAADTAAHSALLTRLRDGRTQAIQNAVDTAAVNLTGSRATNVINTADVSFGRWDRATKTFTPDPNATTAVMVKARRDRSRLNGVNTFVMSFVGLKAWDVNAVAVAETYRPSCLREGFVAENLIDIQSNNGFENGFCMHSNTSISINQNNYFEAGTIVSMPHLDDLDIAASGFKQNDGLLEALRESFYNIRVLNRIQDIVRGLTLGDLPTLKAMTAGGAGTTLEYITNPVPLTVTGCDLTMSNLTTGRIHIVNCGSTLKLGGTIKKVALVTSAQIQFTKEGQFEDAIIATSNTGAMSLKGPAGSGGKKGSGLDNITFGKNDDCAAGGGIQLVTLGGVHMAAGLNMYGSQVLAAGRIEFAANADGIEGVSMVSADTVSGTSNMQMGFCGTGMEGNFEVDYYRLAL